MKPLTERQIAGMIDHTLLKPDATLDSIGKLCREACEQQFAAVCVNPFYIESVSRMLRGSGVKACSAIGFPLGASRSPDKASEAAGVLSDGAQEVDMVIHIGALKDRREDLVRSNISEVAAVCREHGALLKVILETGLLTQEEKELACRLCIEARADFVKTSTGFGFGGATVEDVRLMASIVKPSGLKVKASGGVRTYADACTMAAAGAERIGTSAGLAILDEARIAASINGGDSAD